MKKDNLIDLSDIKENELDKTSSFTDLMSRSQRKAYEKDKKKQEQDKNEIEIKDNKIDVEEYKEIFEDTEEIKEVKKNIPKEEVIEYEDNFKPKIINTIFTGLLSISCIGYYIYLILFTDILMRRKFFICESGIIAAIILLLCINSVGKKLLNKLTIIFIYIFILAFIAINILIKLDIVK